MDRQPPVPYVPIRPVPLAKVHVPYIGILGAGYFEDVFSPAAFRAAEGVSVHSVVTISTIQVWNHEGPLAEPLVGLGVRWFLPKFRFAEACRHAVNFVSANIQFLRERLPTGCGRYYFLVTPLGSAAIDMEILRTLDEFAS